jgi:hypothetical protein
MIFWQLLAEEIAVCSDNLIIAKQLKNQLFANFVIISGF